MQPSLPPRDAQDRGAAGPSSSRSRRLAAHHRLFAALVPASVLVVVLCARFVIPAIWARPWLQQRLLQPCLLRTTTGIPCPFCGATRSVVLAAHGRLLDSARLHPAGIAVVLAGGVAGVWLAICAVSGYDLGVSAAARATRRLASARVLVLLVVVMWLYTVVAQTGR